MYLIGLEKRSHIHERRQRQLAEERPLRGSGGAREHSRTQHGLGSGTGTRAAPPPNPPLHRACACVPTPGPASSAGSQYGAGRTRRAGRGVAGREAAARGAAASPQWGRARGARCVRGARGRGAGRAQLPWTQRGGSCCHSDGGRHNRGGGSHGRRPEGTERPEGSEGDRRGRG